MAARPIGTPVGRIRFIEAPGRTTNVSDLIEGIALGPGRGAGRPHGVLFTNAGSPTSDQVLIENFR